MDILRHYCIQLDFEAGKMRFLDPDHLNTAELGKVFPLTLNGDRPFIQHDSLLGGTSANPLIDTGFKTDGVVIMDALKGRDSGTFWTGARNGFVKTVARAFGRFLRSRNSAFTRGFSGMCVWMVRRIRMSRLGSASIQT